MHGPSFTSNLFGGVLPAPPKSPPMVGRAVDPRECFRWQKIMGGQNFTLLPRVLTRVMKTRLLIVSMFYYNFKFLRLSLQFHSRSLLKTKMISKSNKFVQNPGVATAASGCPLYTCRKQHSGCQRGPV